MRKWFVFMLFMFFTACASSPVDMSKSAEEAYQKAQRIMELEEYGRAILDLEKFSSKYPYSRFATPAELMRLEAAYLDGQYILSETLGLRFVDAHPDDEKRVYAQYLVAMSYYKQSYSAKLDQQFSHRSRDAFLDLNQQFPVNDYSQDIQKYLTILTNRVAEHEVIVGKFYWDKKRYVAATNRFLYVKNKYATADVTAEALFYLVQSYQALQQFAQAREIESLLKSDFSQSEWAGKAALLM
ncbi:MAG: outer membrane protein assembly factor BamD [Mariprofundaceae bacterium]|nr:outer membrane protein assembly factor BamD [Mariprofundaceae bacterium]